MDQNIIGLVLKTSGYPDQVALSGYHGNQVNFKISISKKFLIKIQSTLQLKFLHLLVIYEIYGLFKSWKPFVFS